MREGGRRYSKLYVLSSGNDVHELCVGVFVCPIAESLLVS